MTKGTMACKAAFKIPALIFEVKYMLNFYSFLMHQVGRDDRVGDLAQDAKDDKDFPQKNKYAEIEQYLLDKQACCAAVDSLKQAWAEYKELKYKK